MNDNMNNKINDMVEKLYKIMEEEGMTVNDAHSIALELKIKMDRTKDLIGNEKLKEAKKFK